MPNLKHFNSYNLMNFFFVTLYNFWTYFFTLGEVNGSFSDILTRANNYRIFFV